MVQSSKTFRVFVSSTFADLKEERNALQREVFPKLRKLCMEHGFRFQAIDLRWGVSEEAGLDQQTMKICLEEIQRSQKVSPKPNFIVLLGDRYGWRPLPSEIPADEFEEILTKVSHDDKELLVWDEDWPEEEFSSYKRGWYRKDANAVPAVYGLKPRKVKYPEKASEEEIQNAKDKEVSKWSEIEVELKTIFSDVIEKLGWKDNDKRRFKYESSATEQEIMNGALNPPKEVPDVKDHVFCFFREIKNLKDEFKEAFKHPLTKIPRKEFEEIGKHLENELSTNYYQLEDDFYVLNLDKFSGKENNKLENDIFCELQNAVRKCSFHKEASINDKIKEKYLPNDFIEVIRIQEDEKNTSYNIFDKDSRLKLLKLKCRLNEELSDNIHTYKVYWNQGLTDDHIGTLPDDVIERSEAEKEIDNADTLCVAVWNRLYKIIMEEINKYEEISPLEREILSHIEFGKERTKFFIGREENRLKIKKYLKNSNHKPLFVYGESGSGKSALMAKALEDLSPHFYEKMEKEQLYYKGIIVRFIGATPESSDMRSLLESLCRQITKIYDENEPKIPTEYNELIYDFAQRLKFAKPEKPLYIFLDALDQLSDSETAHNLIWLPDKLPENVHIVFSTLKELFKSSIENRVPEENSNEVLPLEKDEGRSLLCCWLNDEKSGRKLTTIQENEVINKFKTNGMPLYLKLAFEEARRWKSYTPKPELASDIPGIIRQMFARLSKPENHGEMLVSHSLGYLGAAKNGLTEDEMLDILAEDQEVFSLTKKFHQPPEEKLPVALWSRLYFDLEPYLTERSADDTSLVAFYHRQLGEVAQEEYLKEGVKKSRHKLIAEYFYKKNLLFEKKEMKEGERGIDKERVYNIRKVSELPYHEVYGECWGHLENTLCDLRFVEAKCAVGMTYELIKDYNLALDMHPDSQEEKKKQLEHEKRVDKYVEDLIAYSEGKIKHLDMISSVKFQSEEVIKKDIKNIKNNPTQLYIIKAFQQFVIEQSQGLDKFSSLPGFCIQQAYNFAKDGPIAKKAKKHLKTSHVTVILHKKDYLPEYNPYPYFFMINDNKNSVRSLRSTQSISISFDGLKALQGDDEGALIYWDLKYLTSKHLSGHKGPIESISMTPDGKKALTGDYEGNLIYWDLKYLASKHLSGHKGPIESISMTPDGKKALTGDTDGNLIYWDLVEQKSREIKGHDHIYSGFLSFDGKKALVGSTDGFLILWDLEFFDSKILKGHNNHVHSIYLSYDGFKALSMDYDSVLIYWNLKTNENKNLKGHTAHITRICMTTDGKKALTGDTDGNLIYWNLKTNENKNLKGHTAHINGICITADGKKALTGDTDGNLIYWNLETLISKKIETITGNFNGLCMKPDGSKAFSYESKYGFFIWNLDFFISQKFKDHHKSINQICMSNDGQSALSMDDDSIFLWNLKNVVSKKLENSKGKYFNSSIFMTPNGEKAFSLSHQGRNLLYWDLKNSMTKKLNWTSKYNSKVSISPDYRKLLIGDDFGDLVWWDLENYDYKLLESRRGGIRGNFLMPDGKNAFSWDDEGNLLLWDLQTFNLHPFKDKLTYISSVILTPNGKNIILKSWNGKMGNIINLLDLENKNSEEYEMRSSEISVAPDGKMMYLSDYETLIAFDLHTKTFKKFSFEKMDLSNVNIAQDGKWAFFISLDKYLVLINLKNGKIISVYFNPFNLKSVSKIRFNEFLCGTMSGDLYFLEIVNFIPDYPIVTPVRIWLHGDQIRGGNWDENVTTICEWCGKRFIVQKEFLDTIKGLNKEYDLSPDQSQCLEIPMESWEDPRLISECPECNGKIRFNPFIVDNKNNES